MVAAFVGVGSGSARGRISWQTVAALLVDLADPLFEFHDLFFGGLLKRFIGNQQYKLPILHDLHFQVYALVFHTHDSISNFFLIRRRNWDFVHR